MYLIFRTTLLVVRCMIAVPLVATALYFMQSNPWFSMNWFNLAKMFWAVEQTPMLRQHNSPMVFVSWLANLQHKINQTSSEIFVSSSYIPNNWAFFSLSRICFNKSSEIWRHLRFVVLLNSGIFLTLETAFFVHRQWLSGDASKNTFDLFWLVECCDLTRFLDVLEPTYFYQIGCMKQAMRWRIRFQHFFFCAAKPIHNADVAPPFVIFNNTSLFFLNNFLYNCTLLNLDLTQHVTCWHPYSHLIQWSIPFDSYYALFYNYLSLLSFYLKNCACQFSLRINNLLQYLLKV